MRKLVPLLVAVLVVAMAAPVGATPPSDVLFEDVTILDGLEGGGPFTATGPAVDEGIMCDSGDQQDVYAKATGFQSERQVNLQVLKEFVCDDGSGTFMMKIQIKIVFPSAKNPAGSNTFNWVIVGGDGDYEDLHGAGEGFGLGFGPPEVLNFYDGRLHVD